MAKEWLITALGLVLYFGAFLIPVLYLAITKLRGRCSRPMLFGAGTQLALSLLVYLVSELDFRRGNTEAYYWWLLVILLNFVAFLYYACVFAFWYDRPKRNHGKP